MVMVNFEFDFFLKTRVSTLVRVRLQPRRYRRSFSKSRKHGDPEKIIFKVEKLLNSARM